MSNTAYPIGSVHRSRDLWESLPAEDGGEKEVWPSRFFIGLFWMLVLEFGTGLIGWLSRELSR